MPNRKRNIACLESLWEKKTENRLNVLPILELVSRRHGARFSHLNCNTEGEFEYNLKLLCKRNYNILYFGFHGSGGTLYLLDKTKIELPRLAEMMNCNFSDWIVHFGSCGVFRRPNALAEFVEQTRVLLAMGFTKDVNWIESAALELLLFQAYQTYKNPRLACRGIIGKYPDLVSRTGFCFYPEN